MHICLGTALLRWDFFFAFAKSVMPIRRKLSFENTFFITKRVARDFCIHGVQIQLFIGGIEIPRRYVIIPEAFIFTIVE